jgi:malonyl-CoA O-methyltransferase
METLPPAAGPFDVLPTREGYDRWAYIYDDEDNPLIALEEPHVAGLLGEVRGLSVADIGCGTGRHAVRLAAAGARVTALDFSEGMLEKARGKSAGVQWIRHDVSTALPLAPASFDRVLCCLVIDHIADLDLLFQELGRICRREGFIVISSMHPAMMLRGVQAKFHDPRLGREIRPASQPNQISDYVMAACRAGLRIDHLSEHAVDEALARQCPRAEKYLGWPMLLMMRLRPSASA